MKQGLIIAIDGPAASGKSTTAKKLAELLNYTYIDTGAMYRTVALAMLRNKVKIAEIDKINELLSQIRISFRKSESGQHIFLNEVDVSKRIREADITRMSSEIACNKEIRENMVGLQQEMGKRGGVILDGRDIGTVVFPDADFKFFITASPFVRALRRWNEMNNPNVSVEEIEKDIIWRDKNDSNREIAPLKQAKDAILVDTSEMTIEQQVEYLYGVIKQKI